MKASREVKNGIRQPERQAERGFVPACSKAGAGGPSQPAGSRISIPRAESLSAVLQP